MNERKERFWKVIESFSNEDKSLFLKFVTGRKRLATGENIDVNIQDQEGDSLPEAATCGNYISMPHYATEEIMSEKILIAIRLCGEIDNDGGGEYGSEDEGEDEERTGQELEDNRSED